EEDCEHAYHDQEQAGPDVLVFKNGWFHPASPKLSFRDAASAASPESNSARFACVDADRCDGHSLSLGHCGTPSPQRGEGRGEGDRISRFFVTPSPHPSPLRGEGAGRIRGSAVPCTPLKRPNASLRLDAAFLHHALPLVHFLDHVLAELGRAHLH